MGKDSGGFPMPDQTSADMDDAAELVAWVRDVLAPSVNRDLNTHGQLVWCSQWWAHPEAVARLHALRMAYSTLVEDAGAGADGASTWWLQHADPHLAVLLNKDTGPFSQCVRGHRPTAGLPWQDPPRDVPLPRIVAIPDPEDAAVAAAALDG